MQTHPRIQKVLSQQGVCSRRQADTLISAGRVMVNDSQAELGQRLAPGDKLFVDGEPVVWNQRVSTRLLMVNKPKGFICSRHDPKHSQTIFQILPPLETGQWILVGRLDIDTEGLILVTNDGELANVLMHPSSNIDRTYMVRVFGQITEKQEQSLTDGVMLDDGHARFKRLSKVRDKWYRVSTTSGRNRIVRRLFEYFGLQVSRLKRIGFGAFILPKELMPGRHISIPRDDLLLKLKKMGCKMPARQGK